MGRFAQRSPIGRLRRSVTSGVWFWRLNQQFFEMGPVGIQYQTGARAVKLIFPPIAFLLIVSALAGGCTQVERLLGASERSSSEDDEDFAPGAGGSNGPILPSNPVPVGTSAKSKTSASEPVAEAKGDNEPAEPAEPARSRNQPPGRPPERLFTTHNLWYEGSGSMDTMNYKTGKLLPAGTEVAGVVVIKRRFREDTIDFSTPSDGAAFSISWDSKNHPGWTLDEIKERMISKLPFEQLTQGLLPSEVEAIRSGTLEAGMSRKAVLIAYGYPPALSTPNLNSALWKYWISLSKFISVRFDQSGRTRAGEGVKEKE